MAIEQGQPDLALAALDPENPHVWYWGWIASEPEVRARAGDIAGARRAIERLVAVSSRLMMAEAAFAKGLICLAAPNHDSARVELLRSIDLFEALNMPFHVARSRLELAGALVTSDPTRATADAEDALSAFEGIGAKRYAERARNLLASLGVRSRPQRQPARTDGPLSRREHEVALLVAEGLTNAEIAERLTVSVRTVTSHLDHIYTRLGINSRVALARQVVGERSSVRN